MRLISFLFETTEIPEEIQSIQDYLDEFFYIPNKETLYALFDLEKKNNPNFWFKKVDFANHEVYVFGFSNRKNEFGNKIPEFVLELGNEGFDATKVQNWLEDILFYKNSASEYIGIDREKQENDNFWEHPPPLYHATGDKTKLNSILKNGLKPKDETRGLTNKHIGNAIFTSLNPRLLDSYRGKEGGIFRINTAAMKADGYMPNIVVEPEVIEKWEKETLYAKLGMNYEHDYSGGIDEDTIIFKDEIPAKYIELIDEESLNEIVKEPKRENPKTLQQLNIERNAGIKNILAVYNDAEPEEREYWGKWYHFANQGVKELAEKHGVTFPATAAVVAVLSPGNRWSSNLVAADRVLTKFHDPTFSGRINAYGRNVEKALKILETGNIGLVTGPKVTVFFKSLMDPEAVENDMVLDTHAINIWRGVKQAIKGTAMPSVQERDKMIQDYQSAAKQLGVSVQSLQAVTWFVWRYTAKPITVKPAIIKVEKEKKKKVIKQVENLPNKNDLVDTNLAEFLLLEAEKYQFIGQCDRLRRSCENNEFLWQQMIQKAEVIPLKTFLVLADLTPLLDEDEMPEDYISDLLSSDPETSFYQSVWGDMACVFLETSGFEYIFIK